MKDKKIRVLALAEIPALTADDLENRPFEVLKCGDYYDSRYGTFTVGPDLILRLKQNFDKQVLGIDIALDVNHEPEKGAYAWVKSLEIRGDSLWATFRDFTQECQRILLEKVYRYFSVEFAPFDKVEDGTKITVMDVLRGIALTNRPVIKGMNPTFSEKPSTSPESLNANPHPNMNAVKTFAATLLARQKISKEDVGALKVMFATLSEEEKKETAADVAQVEAEAGKAEAEAEKKGGEAEKQLAETSKKLTDTEAELNKFRLAEEQRTLSEATEALMLSEKNLTGFAAPSKDKLAAFVKSLNVDQRKAFSELTKEVKTVTTAMLSEIGAAKDTDLNDEAVKAAKLAEAETKARKRSHETGEELHVALAETYKEMGLIPKAS